MSITLPPIGAKVRAIRKLDGTTVTVEGVITSTYGRGYDDNPNRPPTIVLAGNEHVNLSDTAVHEGIWVHSVEILSGPEPANGSWVTVPTEVEGRPPYVFHRDDDASPYDAMYRWWFHEDGDWVAWVDVEKRGVVTVIKDGAA